MLYYDSLDKAHELYNEMKANNFECVYGRFCGRLYKITYNNEDGRLWAATRDFDDDDIIVFKIND